MLRDDKGHGSGFSLQSGYIVTNKHVIENATSLTIWIDGEEQSAKVWNYSPDFEDG